MKKLIIISIYFMLLAPHIATAESVLTKINKIDTKDSVELYCSFSSIPLYRTNTRGKRVDFILEDTVLNPELTLFPANDKIVKILSQHKNNKTILSFFFRYPPQRFEVTPNPKENKLTVNILLGNPYSLALPDFSSKLAGITILERTTKDFSNPLIASSYAADWRSFFKLYESKIKVTLPVQFTLLPFPAISLLLPEKDANRDILGADIYTLADQNLWAAILPLLLQQITEETDPEIKKKLALTYGEVLSRDNNFEDAYKQFYLLSAEYNEEEIGIFAKYLLILLRARFEDPFIADFEFRKLEKVMNPANPLTPYFLISQIETALSTEQYSRMKTLLARDNIAFPDNTMLIKNLRQADYWYGTGDLVKAYVGYQLLNEHEILMDKVFSLNGYCDTLYQQKKFPEASACYTSLSGHIKNKEMLGIISYRKYIAELQYRSAKSVIGHFSNIEHTYTGTEAGFRGALKKTDLQYLTLEDWSANAILDYKEFTAHAKTRSVREEASFKEALVYRLNNENITSIELTMDFTRDFRGGPLYKTAQALLIELLPIVIKEYVKKEQYMEALILAKKNRKIFQKNWVSINLLAELAKAYNAVGIYNDASRIYLYLITLSSEDKKEQYYLPLIKASYDHGAYSIVEDYSDQYNFRYPDGTYAAPILLLRIKSLLAEEKYSEAISLLPETIPPTEEFSLLAANLYFHENNFDKIVEILDRPLEIDKTKRPRSDFMLAESLYQLGNMELAVPFFLRIPQNSIHHDQAQYRLAEFYKKNGDNEASLKLYTSIVETGTSPLWVQLAQKELDIEFFEKNF